ncbi:MarR family winged helix-turn-helix transcriptional regulator [Spirosoma utsteinense]|uniref:MarR family transcriptional repressor of mepA n=1 Tax=Spirosoma utsteinense TaxID=2585773 RepID=A0ABR6W6J2_9BACT|nr:MarR family transcriptional regulator [Spirosoma utsteinense]MBC3787891.1 MarR family transcriptional repressor of mepA [Spirosoma utsteinense]MBC3792188.1 MarR family transcriptional repressor of mepA [Spirosoma utsteinense]
MTVLKEMDIQARFTERMGTQSIFLISHVGHLMARKANRELARLGFTLQIEQFPVLFIVYFSGDDLLSQQDIANFLQKDKSGIQRSVRTLERDGYLRVVADSEDRRKNLIRLTPAGKMIIEQAIKTTETIDEEVMSQLTAEERDTFLKTTRKIAILLEK